MTLEKKMTSSVQNMECVVITGGSGFIGLWIANVLLKHNPDLLLINLDIEPCDAKVKAFYELDDEKEEADRMWSHVRKRGFDLYDKKFSCCSFLEDWIQGENVKVDMVVHCAADAAEVASNVRSTKVIKDNVLLSNSILNLCVNNEIKKFVFVSSVAAHDPVDVYGLTKEFTEKQVKLYGDIYGIDYRIIRLQNVFGPGQSFTDPGRNVIGIWTRSYIENEPATLYNDADCCRYFTPVYGILSYLLESMFLPRNEYSIRGKDLVMVGNMFNMFCSVVGKDIEKKYSNRVEKETTTLNEAMIPGFIHLASDNNKKRVEDCIRDQVRWSELLDEIIQSDEVYFEKLQDLVENVDIKSREEDFMPGLRMKYVKMDNIWCQEKNEIPF